MKPVDVTVDWPRSLDYRISPIGAPPAIEGVQHHQSRPITDGCGDLTESRSEPWDRFIPPAHVYQSGTDYGVVKCWHLHAVPTDQFATLRGTVQVGLVDVREGSSTCGHVNAFMFGIQNPALPHIPPGITYGRSALSSPEIQVLNLQSHMYDAVTGI